MRLPYAMAKRHPPRQSATIPDLTALLHSLGGDRVTLRKLALMFIEDSPRQLSALREALAQGDTSTLEHLAHRLKGTAGYFASDGTFAAAARLETIARSRIMDGAHAACAELERQIIRLARALAGLDQKRSSRLEDVQF